MSQVFYLIQIWSRRFRGWGLVQPIAHGSSSYQRHSRYIKCRSSLLINKVTPQLSWKGCFLDLRYYLPNFHVWYIWGGKKLQRKTRPKLLTRLGTKKNCLSNQNRAQSCRLKMRPSSQGLAPIVLTTKRNITNMRTIISRHLQPLTRSALTSPGKKLEGTIPKTTLGWWSRIASMM